MVGIALAGELCLAGVRPLVLERQPQLLQPPKASAFTVHTGQGTTSVAELMRAARPVFLDLAGRQDLRRVAMDWRHRIDIRTAKTDRPPADALLIRPDACIAWAAATGEPAGAAAPGLREALGYWFGPPRTA